MGGVALPPWWLFGLRPHSPEVYSLYGGVNGEPQRGLLQGEPSSAPVPVASSCWPTLPQEALQH